MSYAQSSHQALISLTRTDRRRCQTWLPSPIIIIDSIRQFQPLGGALFARLEKINFFGCLSYSDRNASFERFFGFENLPFCKIRLIYFQINQLTMDTETSEINIYLCSRANSTNWFNYTLNIAIGYTYLFRAKRS